MKEYLRKRHNKYYKEHQFRHLHIWGDILFVFLILVLAATLFYLRHYQPFSGVSLELKSPTEVVSGQESDWEIYYHANKALTGNTLTVRWPDNFSITKTDFAGEYNQTTNTFYLDDLEKGANGKIVVSARAFGSLNEKQLVSANFNCAECGVGFLNTFSYEIKSSALAAELLLPEDIYSGAEFSASLKIRNNATVEMKDISFILNDNWNIADGDLNITSLAPGEEKEILWHLSNSLNPGVSKILLDVKSRGLTQVSINRDLDIKESSFKLSILSSQKVADRQGTVEYVLAYDNLSQEKLTNLSLNISGADSIHPVNLPSNWTTQANNLYIEEIAPQGSGRLVFSLKYNTKRTDVNQILVWDIQTAYKINGESIKLNFKSEAIKIVSDTTVKAAVYYYSPQGDQLGVGPLPPTVGMATSYWLMVDLSNYGNKLSNFSLSFDMPSQVFLTGQRSVLNGDFHYAAISNSVIWKLPELEASKSKYSLGVEIALAPEDNDIGKVLTLINNLRYSATDEFTGQEISGTLNDLDTNLLKDPLAINKGVVVAY